MKKELKQERIRTVMLCIFYTFVALFVIFGSYYYYIDLYSVYLMQEEVTIDNGNTYQIELLPKNSNRFDYKNYVFDVEDNSIVNVNDHGEVTSLKEGATQISIRFKNGFEKEKLKINVKNVEVSDLELEKNFSVTVNNTKKIQIKVNNQKNVSTSLSYTSENPSIAKVDNYGNVTGVKEGVTNISVTSGNGISQKVVVNVKANKLKIQEINIVQKELNLKAGSKKTLSLHTVPNSASTKDLKWKSSNTSVATVDSNGVVKAISKGHSIISVSTKEGLNSQITVYVSEDEEILLDKYNIKIAEGSTTSISANIPVKYKSSNTKIATVDDNGNITAKKAGKAIITVSAGSKKSTCQVVVYSTSNKTQENKTKENKTKETKPKVIAVESIELSDTNIILTEGENKSLTATVNPSNATNKNVSYTSENASVASVDSNGKITAVSAGQTKIVVTSESNKNVKFETLVTVKAREIEVSSISLNTSNKTLLIGDSLSLNVNFVPQDATNKKITWTSSNTSVATVDANGKVVAKKEGSAKITATSNNNKTATVQIKVEKKKVEVKQVEINSNVTSMYVGDTITLSAVVTPNDADNKKVVWTSSNTSVATVDSYGKVVAKKSGSVKITATSSSNSSISDSKTIAVNNKHIAVTKLNTSTTTYTLKYGKSLQWNVSVEPSDATNKQIVYTSSNESIAKVSSTGKITAQNTKGTATITAKSKENNNIKVSITITVVADPLVNAANYKKVNYSNFKWKYYYTGRGPIGEYYSKSLPYAIYAPENVSDLNGVSLPLIIWLHGGGQLEGKDFLKAGLPRVIIDWGKTKLAQVPAIIIAPHTGNQWTTDKEFEMVKQSIDWAKMYYNIDTDNVVLMGHSMGGRGVVFLSYGMYHKYKKNFFSAIVAMTCNVKGAYPTDNPTDGYNYFSKVNKIRVYSEAIESSGFLDWLGRSNQFIHLNSNHGAVPYNAMAQDLNNDGVSDLVNWIFNLDGKS